MTRRTLATPLAMHSVLTALPSTLLAAFSLHISWGRVNTRQAGS